MKIPERYRSLDLYTWWTDAYDLDLEGRPQRWPAYSTYPPLGFLPLGLFDIGNGDLSGFYWPLGREMEEPLLCDTYHDYYHVEPYASSLEGLVKLKALAGYCDPDDEEDDSEYGYYAELAGKLGFDLPQSEEEPSPAARLALDPRSPSALHSSAEEALQAGDLEAAEQHLTLALTMLPEYTDALYSLVTLYRRQRRHSEAARTMLEVLSGPRCFGRGRDKCLQWLQRLSDADYPELADDPLWQRRHQITFITGVKRNDDFLLYEEAIAAYLEQGKGVLAVRLRILVGELMRRETISFRERYGFTEERHLQLLREALQRAGLGARLPAIDLAENNKYTLW